jgi:hypothetical protein
MHLVESFFDWSPVPQKRGDVMNWRRLRAKWKDFGIIYRRQGVIQLTVTLGKWVLASICQVENQVIMGHRLGEDRGLSLLEVPSQDYLCTCLEGAEQLQSLANQGCGLGRDLRKLEERLTDGCVIFLACEKTDKRRAGRMLGYCIAERGVFSAQGRRWKISSDALFIHYTEVFPEFRGNRIYLILSQAREAYCRQNGLSKLCSVILTSNQSSLKASQRAGFRIIGSVKRFAWLRGLYVWQTPQQKISGFLSDLKVQGDSSSSLSTTSADPSRTC